MAGSAPDEPERFAIVLESLDTVWVMSYITNKSTPDNIGSNVKVAGWVHSIRDMGKMAFIDLRDYTGLVQVVTKSQDLPKIGVEWVIEVEGAVKQRGEKFVNPKLATGTVELLADKITVLSQAQELPIEIKKDTRPINEETRLKYRYLDLRSERMQTNLKMRHRAASHVRRFLEQRDFIEVETPLLTKGTPEGAREFLVPSRQHPGSFYVLPQSPQQFKQLLMVAGIGRYFQIARALRDEDQRGDRQPEHTQIDMELAFVEEEDILGLCEEMIISLVAELWPDKRVSETPFPRIKYDDCIKEYGTDKPDLRRDKQDQHELAFVWVTDFPMFETEKSTGKITAVHHPFTAPKPGQSELIKKQPLQVKASAYDLALNGHEIGGGSMRINDQQLQRQVFEVLGLSAEEVEGRFGHMLEAFGYGTPPHGGIAFGMDRLLMVLLGEANIREVMAFPKTGDGRDPMTGAPGPVKETALKEVHIKVEE